MSRTYRKRAPSWQRTVLTVLCVILALILSAMILITIYVESLFSRLNRDDTASTSPSLSGADSTLSTGVVIPSEGTINIMLLGTDLSDARSDTMILGTFNRAEKSITLTSFMRDTYVDIPNYFHHKMNTAFALDGYTSLCNTLIENFGVQPDGYVAVNFESFIQVVDIIGGIEIELTEEEALYMMSTPWNGLDATGWDLTAGVQTLNGDQALAYSRIRDISDSEGNWGDFGRTNRQRRVLKQVVNQCKSLNVFKLNSLLNEILPKITTNLSNSDIVSYALEILPVLSSCTIESQQIPAEGTYHLDWVDQDGGMSVIWVDDFDANREILEGIIGN